MTDAFEGPHGEADFAPPPRASGTRLTSWFKTGISQRRPLQLLWFGHESNWSSMQQALAELPHAGVGRIELEIITSAGCGVEAFCEQFNARHRRVCYLRFTPWSLEAMWTGMARAALVLIPSRLDEQGKAVKSPNRLVETLRGGRFAIADAVPSYRSLAPYCHLGGGMVAGLNWALDRPNDVRARIAEGQAYVEANYSPAAVATAWESVLEQTLTASP